MLLSLMNSLSLMMSLSSMMSLYFMMLSLIWLSHDDFDVADDDVVVDVNVVDNAVVIVDNEIDYLIGRFTVTDLKKIDLSQHLSFIECCMMVHRRAN